MTQSIIMNGETHVGYYTPERDICIDCIPQYLKYVNMTLETFDNIISNEDGVRDDGCYYETVNNSEYNIGFSCQFCNKSMQQLLTEWGLIENTTTDEPSIMKPYTVYVDDTYTGDVKAMTPLHAIESTIWVLAANGCDIRNYHTAKATYDTGLGYDNAYIYNLHMNIAGDMIYHQVG